MIQVVERFHKVKFAWFLLSSARLVFCSVFIQTTHVVSCNTCLLLIYLWRLTDVLFLHPVYYYYCPAAFTWETSFTQTYSLIMGSSSVTDTTTPNQSLQMTFRSRLHIFVYLIFIVQLSYAKHLQMLKNIFLTVFHLSVFWFVCCPVSRLASLFLLSLSFFFSILVFFWILGPEHNWVLMLAKGDPLRRRSMLAHRTIRLHL